MLLQAYADVQMNRMKRAIEKYTQRTQDRPDDAAAGPSSTRLPSS